MLLRRPNQILSCKTTKTSNSQLILTNSPNFLQSDRNKFTILIVKAWLAVCTHLGAPNWCALSVAGTYLIFIIYNHLYLLEGRRAGKPVASYSSSSSLSIPATGVSNGMTGGADSILPKAWQPPLKCGQRSNHCHGDTNTSGNRNVSVQYPADALTL